MREGNGASIPKLALVEKDAPGAEPEYLSVRDAAALLGVSVRSVYNYIRSGRLSCCRQNHKTIVRRKDIELFVSPRSDSARNLARSWYSPGHAEAPLLTTITLRLPSGQDTALLDLLDRISQARFTGLVAGSLVRNQRRPGEFKLLLFWNSVLSSQEREAALSTLAADLADVVDRQMVRVEEWQVVCAHEPSAC